MINIDFSTTIESVQAFTDAMYDVTRLTIYGQPIPKERPRTGRGKTYTPPKTEAYKELVQLSIAHCQNYYSGEMAIGVILLFYRKDKRRADVDNLQKAVLDACNGILWRDDTQIEAATQRVFYSSKEPRVEMVIVPLKHYPIVLGAMLDKLGQ